MRSLLLASFVSLATVAVAQSPLTTTMIGGLALTATAPFSNTLYFDTTVTVGSGLILSQIDIRAQDLNAATSAFDVYLTAPGGTHVGNHSLPAVWGTKRSSASGFVADVTGAANIVLDTGIFLLPGTYGVALHCKNFRHVYTNGSTQIPPLPTLFSTAELSADLTSAVIQNSTSAAPFSGGQSAVRTLNMRLHYQMTSLLTFAATPRTGTGPMNVQFTNGSASMDPLGFTVFAWDLDGDNIDDDFTTNPLRSYTCGDYSVRLTAFDALGNYQVTRTNFIVVDALAANFTWQKIAEPALFQFTAVTSPSASGWQWDLDGIPGVDATNQNPVWSYTAGCGPIPVSLTATNSCRTASRTITFAPQSSIATTLVAGNAGATGYAMNFDANVTATNGIEVCGIHVNVNTATAGGALTCDVYTRDGTYVGNDVSIAGWSQVSGTGTAEVIGTPTYIQLATPVYLTPGIHGFTVVLTGAGLAYTNGNGTNQSYSNADVTLTLGQVRTVAFSGTSTLFTPRVFNGRLNYSTAATGMAGYYTYGAGCPGTLGIPGNVASARPRVGQNMVVDFTNTPLGVIPFIGFSNTLFSGFPLPIEATPLGAAGCFIRSSADINAGLFFSAGGTANWVQAIPADPVFLGLNLYIQAFSFDPAINTLGGTFSDAASGLIGN